MSCTRLCKSIVDFQFLFLFCTTVIYVIILLPFVSTSCTTCIGRKLAEKETDEVALRAFKSKITHDPQGVLNSWNDSRHFCEWEGITCSRRHKRVTVLYLTARGLNGFLSPFIGNLSFLRQLFLDNNSFQVEIPGEFGRLYRLKSLFLFSNLLVGEIPANLSHCSKLSIFSVGDNKLVGKIPSEFVSLYNLEALAVHMNNLTGGIPPFLGNLTLLRSISAGENAFGGFIPDSLGRLKRLWFLGLAGNNHSGTVPHSLWNLSFLANLSLSFNQLHGSLPPNLGLGLPHLLDFRISENFFVGSIPVSLSNASKLEAIEMFGNNFSGKLSVDFGGMQFLKILNLGSNNLGSQETDEMDFITSLTNCSNLRALSLGANQFGGALPHSIANFSNTLLFLQFSQNQLSGSVPPGIADIDNLYLLGMNENQLTGPIPREIEKLQNLQVLAFYDNQLSGEIPSSLGNMSKLSILHLHNNKLSGVIPSSLGNLKQLSILNLFQNDLIGTIPKHIFNITYLSLSLNLAQNHLVGPIPQNIGNLKSLLKLDLFHNNLSGEIPNELGLCSNLEYLYMEHNILHGSIPQSLSSLKGIRHIDFSHNNLSGQIPKFLETLALEYLNLSFNDLEGEVPMKGIFANASAISIVGNSDRLCGGIIELQLPKCPNRSKSDKISSKLKILIATASVVFGLVVISVFILCWVKKRREQQASGFFLEKAFFQVSYERLLKATNEFSRTHLIGVGSFGSVYKGSLGHQETIVAIKVFNLQQQEAFKSFMVECKALRNIRHRNLVRVITACSSIDFQGNDFKAIVYEFMPNGSLEKWLHLALETEEEFEVQSLTLEQRISIAIDVASALDYLHHHCHKPILHCDIKPSNVLLDNDMTARIGDFGLAKFLPEIPSPNGSSSIGVRGTIGYIAPEYGLGSDVSITGDIYSYGILLLEMVTKKKPTDPMFEGDLNLHNFVRMALPDHVMELVDPVLINEGAVASDHIMRQSRNNNRDQCLISMARIGVACSTESPQDRMNISQVVHELQLARNIFLQSTSG